MARLLSLRSGALLLAALCSCRSGCGGASSSSAPALSADPTPAARAKGRPVKTERCGPMLEQNRAKIEASPEAPPPEIEGNVKLDEACYPTPAGAWGLRLLSWETKVDEGEAAGSGRLEVVHFVAAAEASWPMATARTPAGMPISMKMWNHWTELETPRLVDIDGDGEPELFFTLRNKEHEGPLSREAMLLTVRAGTVQPYPGLPAGVEDMDDVDHDGHMDFIYYPYEQMRESPCSGFGFTWRGPALLAHGLAGGTFSLDDDVAVGFARRACPAAPVAGVTTGVSPEHDDATPPEVCARLWGKSVAEAMAVLRAQCRPVKKGADPCQPAKGECADLDDREQAVKAPPPVRLR